MDGLGEVLLPCREETQDVGRGTWDVGRGMSEGGWRESQITNHKSQIPSEPNAEPRCEAVRRAMEDSRIILNVALVH